MTLSLPLGATFFLLAALHVYWFWGGKWALQNSLPQNENGDLVLKAGKFGALIVGIGLAIFGCLVLMKGGLLNFGIPAWLNNNGVKVISAIFLLRTIGDFRYVGFFKSIKNTGFAKADTKIYTPLCLLIAALAGVIGFA